MVYVVLIVVFFIRMGFVGQKRRVVVVNCQLSLAGYKITLKKDKIGHCNGSLGMQWKSLTAN